MKKDIKILLAVIICVGIVFAGVKIFSTSKAKSISSENDESISVTLEVECKDIFNNKDKLDKALDDKKYISENGELIEAKKYTVKVGETAFDLLKKVTSDKGILLDYSGSGSTVYVKGINSIYEYSCGKNSGWIYYINEKSAEKSCGDYKLSDNDKIRFSYVCDYTKND